MYDDIIALRNQVDRLKWKDEQNNKIIQQYNEEAIK